MLPAGSRPASMQWRDLPGSATTRAEHTSTSMRAFSRSLERKKWFSRFALIAIAGVTVFGLTRLQFVSEILQDDRILLMLCTLPFFGLMSLVLRYLDSGRAEAQRRKSIAIQTGKQTKLRKALGIRSPSKAAAEYALELHHKGCDLERACDLDGAIEAYRASTIENPEASASHLALGRLLLQQGSKDEARASIVRALELDASSDKAREAFRAYCLHVSPEQSHAAMLTRELARIDMLTR